MSAKHKRVFWPVMVLTVAALSALVYVSARTKLKASAARTRAEVSQPPPVVPKAELAISGAPPTPLEPRGPVRMIRFTLFENGIFPKTLRVQTGRVQIAFEDKTNSTQGLVVDRLVDNARITQIRRAENHWRGRELLLLTPGRYRIYDASRPDNTAELIVEP